MTGQQVGEPGGSESIHWRSYPPTPKVCRAVALVMRATSWLSMPHTRARGFAHQRNPGRLVGLSPMRRRGQIRRVRLHHRPRGRDDLRSPSHRIAGGEGNRTGEGEPHPQLEKASGPAGPARPTVHHRRRPGPGLLQQAVNIRKSVPTMHHQGLSKPRGKLDLGTERLQLLRSGREVPIEVQPGLPHRRSFAGQLRDSPLSRTTSGLPGEDADRRWPEPVRDVGPPVEPPPETTPNPLRASPPTPPKTPRSNNSPGGRPSNCR